MSLTRSFLSTRRSSSIRCFSRSKSRPPTSSSDDLLPYNSAADDDNEDGSRWASLLPELLAEIIGRVESSEDKWPVRKNVVACACVCKRWRDVTREMVKSPVVTGRITFPSCLKQPGPRDFPLQCLIKRDKKNSTFYLHLSVSPSSFFRKGEISLSSKTL